VKLNKPENESKFNPFEITLVIESEKEAKLLFHVFNHPSLKKALFSNPNYASGDAYSDVPNNFSYAGRNEIVEYLHRKIEDNK
jgi:hypothetical protein